MWGGKSRNEFLKKKFREYIFLKLSNLIDNVNLKNIYKSMSRPGFEPGLLRPQRNVLTTRRSGPKYIQLSCFIFNTVRCNGANSFRECFCEQKNCSRRNENVNASSSTQDFATLQLLQTVHNCGYTFVSPSFEWLFILTN